MILKIKKHSKAFKAFKDFKREVRVVNKIRPNNRVTYPQLSLKKEIKNTEQL